MDFLFSPEQDDFRHTLREFATAELAPGYRQRSASHAFPWAEVRRLAELGVLGLGIPEELGGQGATDNVTFGVAVEEIAYADFNLGFMPFVAGLIGGMILRHATAPAREEWLPRLAAGDAAIAFALTEPHAGSDAAAIVARGTPVDGGFVLTGEKTSVTMAPHAQACIVFCRTEDAPGARGVSALLVPLDQPGISRGAFTDMGMLPIGRGQLFFDDVFVPEEQLVGERGGAFRAVMSEFDFSRALLGLMVVAAARASLDEAIEHAKTRTAFGQPLARWEGVSFTIAEHLTLLEAGRWLAYRTLWLRDAGLPHTKEAAMCKWWLPRLAAKVIHDALLVHGHGGYSDEYPIQQRLRDVIGLELGDGAAEIQKIVIVREAIGRAFLPY